MAVTFSTGRFGENKKDVLTDLGTQEHAYTPFYEHRSKTEKARGNSKPRNPTVFGTIRDSIEDFGPKTLNLASLRGCKNRKNDF